MSETLVAWFSPTGTTTRVGLHLAEKIDATAFVIEPEVPYTSADLDWRDPASRSTLEMNDPASRPALSADTLAFDVSDFDTIFLGFPIWWYVAPTIVNTWLESIDTSGKTIILFATSGSSRFGNTLAALKKSLSPDTRIVEGAILNDRRAIEDFYAWAAERQTD